MKEKGASESMVKFVCLRRIDQFRLLLKPENRELGGNPVARMPPGFRCPSSDDDIGDPST